MSIFKRSSSDAEQATAAAPPKSGPEAAPANGTAGAPGVLPPSSAPVYSVRQPTAAHAESEAEGPVAVKVRAAREAQQNAQERLRVAVRRTKTAPPAPGVQSRTVQQQPSTPPVGSRHQASTSVTVTQAGLLNLAWRWQEAGAPIRAINAYVELLTRYPQTPAAAAAVEDLVALSERLADEGQFHTALVIYDHLEQLA
jgi:hypothetical protein